MDLSIINAILNFLTGKPSSSMSEIVDELEENINADRKTVRKHVEMLEILDKIEKVEDNK